MEIKQSLQYNSSKSNIFFKLIEFSNKLLVVIAGFSLMSMMLLIVFNSIKRMFSSPIVGTTELVGLFAAITILFSIGHTQIDKGHVYIDLLVVKLPLAVQNYIHSIVNIVSILFFGIATWLLIMYGFSLKENNVISETLQLPYYPIVLICSLGYLNLSLILIKETVLIWKEKK